MFRINLGWQRQGWKVALAIWLAIGGAIASFKDCALAQIKSDGTLGADESSAVRPLAPGSTVDVISGGATRGANLFHSFEQFSVQTGRTAFFKNAADIQNIVSRVTGSSISNIDGLIRANGVANLFLINPNGIIFGPNAQLNIGGSFMASTASSLNFADGKQFSATAPTTTLLAVSVPLGLQYGRTVKSIRNQSQAINSSGQVVGLQVQPGKTLALVGGHVKLDGGNLQAPDSRVELGGLAEAGTLGLNVNGNNLSLSFPDRVARADVSLTNGSAVDVTAEGGGSIAINARNLSVLGGSSLSAGIQSGLGSVGRQAGDVTLSATDAITIEQMSSIGNNVETDAIGQGGNLMIKTGQLLIRNGGTISTSTQSQGEGGDLDVIVSDFVEVAGRLPNGRSPSSLAAGTTGTGAAGNLRIQTRQLLVRDGASVSVSTDSIEENAGAGGNLTIETGQLVVRGGGQITAATAGVGAGGTLIVNASESVEVDGIFTDGRRRSSLETSSGFYEPTLSNATAKAGSLTIHTPRLSIKGGAVVSTSTQSQGEGGDLDVIASDFVEVAGRSPRGRRSSLVADTEGTGTAGNLRIQTRQLLVRDGGTVSAETSGSGQGGTLSVAAPESVSLSGMGSLLSAAATADGNAGNLTINTPALTVEDEVEVSASTVSGIGGDIMLGGLNSLLVSNGGRVSASTNTGQAGSVTVNAFENAAELVQLHGQSTSLSAQATGNGNAGNLTINTRQLMVQDQAEVSTSTGSGQGGDITLQGLDSLQVSNSEISASTENGQAGSLSVNATNSVELSGTLANGEPSGLSVQATNGGIAGSLRITTGQLTVKDGAQATVSSPKGQAGDLITTANSMLLDRGNLTAVTGNAQGESGANITLQVRDLLRMHNESQISADALATADGGNINIDANFLIVQPPTGPSGSDIRANAVGGNGGRLNITASGIFGIEFRPSSTPLNDITASSEFGEAGVVTFNTPDVDPSEGLVELPAELVDVSNQIVQTCPAGREGESEFIVTGRGGLPPSPTDLLNEDAVWIDLNSTTQLAENRPSLEEATQTTNSTAEPLVEATGWTIDDKGQVILIAASPASTPNISKAQCHAS